MKYCCAFGYFRVRIFCCISVRFCSIICTFSLLVFCFASNLNVCHMCFFFVFRCRYQISSISLHCIALRSDSQIQFFIYITILALITRIEIHRFNLMIAVASRNSHNILQEKQVTSCFVIARHTVLQSNESRQQYYRPVRNNQEWSYAYRCHRNTENEK